jgi:hypothetical protein
VIRGKVGRPGGGVNRKGAGRGAPLARSEGVAIRSHGDPLASDAPLLSSVPAAQNPKPWKRVFTTLVKLEPKR